MLLMQSCPTFDFQNNSKIFAKKQLLQYNKNFVILLPYKRKTQPMCSTQFLCRPLLTFHTRHANFFTSHNFTPFPIYRQQNYEQALPGNLYSSKDRLTF
jgi:hypothetical protein